MASKEPPESAPGPIALVHGIGVASHFVVLIAELLSPSHWVYAPDLPGFGESCNRVYFYLRGN